MIDHPHLKRVKSAISKKNDEIAERRLSWIKRNPYYYKQLLKSISFIIPAQAKVLNVRCSVGYILNALQPSFGLGVDTSQKQVEQAKKRYPHLNFQSISDETVPQDEKFDYVLVSSPEDIVDIKAVLDSIKGVCKRETRVVISSYNYGWHTLVKLAEWLKLKLPQQMHNWLAPKDIDNMLELSGFETIYHKKIILLPFNIPLISYILNRFVARLPVLRHLCMMNITTARLIPGKSTPSVSIVIPCRNEKGNIKEAIARMPDLCADQEIIFGDDKSTDGTREEILEAINANPRKQIKLVDSPGINKANNVWACFDAAQHDVLIILDADLTVIPEELPYFYEAIAQGKGEFINGSRLLYPMHEKAMRYLNVLGNKFFSLFFSYILDTNIKDTLCGTKVLYRTDYEKIKKWRNTWGVSDRWGDYELIFGAAKTHLKMIDMPVHYMDRTYGETKMTGRIKQGLTMLQMSFVALFRIKFH